MWEICMRLWSARYNEIGTYLGAGGEDDLIRSFRGFGCPQSFSGAPIEEESNVMLEIEASLGRVVCSVVV
jgi:hypothetical protein